MTPAANPKDQASEYIDDSALRAAEKDAFGHNDFVDELVHLAGTVRPQTNIAVFAPWGSGKSSLAELLEIRFNRVANVKFATFDAFKFAETSLSRHFITQLADKLGVMDRKFERSLHSSTNSKDLKVPKKAKRKILWSVGIVAGAVLAVLFGLALLFGHLDQPGADTRNWPDYLIAMLPTWAVVTAVGALLWQFVGLKYSFDVTTNQASSEEQFEKQFKRVIKKARKKFPQGVARNDQRIVVFIDELDRCSNKEVVKTLETLKTFLDVDPCIFIVAADRQVLDKALAQEARQATPENIENPYYSAGSAYLDKIFQHQLELPPFTSPSLTAFALELVSDRGGVWAELDESRKKYLFSVLIPTHVTNPRRVKVLLNSFVTTYNLMTRRVKRGNLEDDSDSTTALNDRLEEIAKLVCLRCEFPNFAAELSTEDRLPALILDEVGIKEIDAEVDRRAREIAAQFVRKERYVAPLIASDKIKNAGNSTAAETEPADRQDEARNSSLRGSRQSIAGIEDRESRVASTHFRQLVSYLQKTERIGGPYADLIFLASESSNLAISEADARELGRAARNNEFVRASRIVARQEGAELDGAWAYLANLMDQRFGEIEGDNVILCVSSLCASHDFSEESGELLAHAFGKCYTRLDLLVPLADATGLLRLTRLNRDPFATTLREMVAKKADLSQSESARIELLKSYPSLSDSAKRTAAASLDSLVRGDDILEPAIEAVLQLPNSEISDLFQRAEMHFGKSITSVSDDESSSDDEQATRHNNLRTREFVSVIIEGLAENDRSQVAQEIIDAILPYADDDLLRAQFDHFASGTETTSTKLIEDLLDSPRGTDEIAPWLEAARLDPDGDFKMLVYHASNRLGNDFTSFTNEAHSVDEFREQIKVSMEFLNRVGGVNKELVAEAIGDVLRGASEPDEEFVKRFELAVAGSRVLIELDAISANTAGTSLVVAAAIALSSEQIVPYIGLFSSHVKTLMVAQSFGPESDPNALEDLRESFANQGALAVPDRAAGQLRCIAARLRRGIDTEHEFTATRVGEIYTEFGTAFEAGLQIWILFVAGSSEDIWTAVQPRASEPFPKHVEDAIANRAAKLSTPQAIAELNRGAVGQFIQAPVNSEFFTAAKLRSAHESMITSAFAKSFPVTFEPQQLQNAFAFVRIWRPESESAQRSLITKLLIPAIQGSQQAAEITFDNYDAYRHFSTAKRSEVINAFKAGLPDIRKPEVEGRFQEIGWLQKPRKLFGKKLP